MAACGVVAPSSSTIERCCGMDGPRCHPPVCVPPFEQPRRCAAWPLRQVPWLGSNDLRLPAAFIDDTMNQMSERMASPPGHRAQEAFSFTVPSGGSGTGRLADSPTRLRANSSSTITGDFAQHTGPRLFDAAVEFVVGIQPPVGRLHGLAAEHAAEQVADGVDHRTFVLGERGADAFIDRGSLLALPLAD